MPRPPFGSSPETDPRAKRPSLPSVHDPAPGAIAGYFHYLRGATAVDIQQTIDNDAWIMGNDTQLHPVLMNRRKNAARAVETWKHRIRMPPAHRIMYQYAGIRKEVK